MNTKLKVITNVINVKTVCKFPPGSEWTTSGFGRFTSRRLDKISTSSMEQCFRSYQSLRHSRNCPPCKESESSLLCSLEPHISPCAEPDKSSLRLLHHNSLIHLNIIFPHTLMSLRWTPLFRFSNYISVIICHLSHTCYMNLPSHPP